MSEEAKWYVAHTYSGYEEKVKTDLEKTVKNRNLQDMILEVKYPVKRAVYDKQFKMAAVKLAQESDKSVTQTATELGISGCSLRRWINEYDEYGESAFPGHGNALFNSTYEVKKLQKRVKELEMENDLLKKLQAFLKQKNV